MAILALGFRAQGFEGPGGLGFIADATTATYGYFEYFYSMMQGSI